MSGDEFRLQTKKRNTNVFQKRAAFLNNLGHPSQVFQDQKVYIAGRWSLRLKRMLQARFYRIALLKAHPLLFLQSAVR